MDILIMDLLSLTYLVLLPKKKKKEERFKMPLDISNISFSMWLEQDLQSSYYDSLLFL